MLSSDSLTTVAGEAELVPEDCLTPLNFEAIFGREAPIQVDLGCGDGSFLASLASDNPDQNFLGIERLFGRVRTACRKVERAGLVNARVMRFEISYAVQYLVPANSITTFHLMFPDPWPKRRHASRRIISENLLVSLGRALVPGGKVWIATDDSDYFKQIARMVSHSPLFEADNDALAMAARSKFERRFTQRGVPIHRLVLRKLSPVT
jgi:tRNA (guanine-N7-)-methyltransferase